ncbi:hypothetical protein YPPY64_1656, partial [Yersinia pestis PY-64]
MLWITL